MGAGGGDQQRSSYTARVIVCTELDKMDEAGGSSREADPVSQIKARSSAYGSSARFYGECTMSVKGGRIYREVVERGTDSRVFLPCPHCRTWILPTRDGLVGWQDAPDVIEARARVRFKCSACGGLWTEEDRQKALKDPRVVTKGQEVGADGAVTGARPATMTFGFRWNSMSSPLRTMADIAREEWNAQQSGNREEEKALVQFTWAEPWEEEIADLNRPEIETVFGKIVGHERGTVPPDAVKTTLGIDVGSYVIWWSLYAWKSDAQGHLVDFGGIDVPLTGGKKNPAAVLAALRAYRDNVILPGWGGRRPDRIVIDSGYEQAVVYEFVKESGQPRYLAAKGYGSSSRHGGWRDPSASEPSETRHVGNQWLVSLQPGGIRLLNFHSDYWKAHIHDGFGAAQGAPGSITIFRGEKTDAQLRTFARMIVAEQREIKSTGDKEPKVVWVVKSRTNHYLDTSAMARLAADLEGVRLVKSSAKLPVPAGIRPPKRDVRGWVRTRY
jgi:phage terminase large subunit GpA-like protein